MKIDLIKQATDSLWCATGRPWRYLYLPISQLLIARDFRVWRGRSLTGALPLSHAQHGATDDD